MIIMKNPESIITDEMQSFIGTESIPVTYEITHREIAKFNSAITGTLPPIENDPTSANEKSTLRALPTFVRSLIPGSFEQPFPEPFHDILDGGSTYTFKRHIVAGDRITVVRKLVDVYEKTGRLGGMLFKISEIRYTDAKGEIVATQLSTTITYGRRAGSV